MALIVLVFCFAATALGSATGQSDRDAAKLYDAIDSGSLSEVQSLIEGGIRLNDENLEPLHHSIKPASNEFNEEIFRLLINSGANLEAVNGLSGRTPLYEAVFWDNPKAVRILLEHGANANTFDHDKMSALGKVFSRIYIFPSGKEIIDLLIKYGAEVNETDSNGVTLLQKAISRGHKKAIKLLIEKGANVNVVEAEQKMTPLHYIASYGFSTKWYEDWTEDDRLKIAELLVSHGADLNAKAHIGYKDKTPLDMATSPKLREYLQRKMA